MKMYELDHTQVERIREDAEYYMASEADIRTVLKDMYCRFFSDKTDDIGYVMADKVLSLVSDYNQDICDAKTDSDTWLENKIRELLVGKETLTERCNTLYQARIAMAASNIYATEGKDAAEAYQREHGTKVFWDNEVTTELEQKLNEELKEVILNNKVLLGAMEAFAQRADCSEDTEYATIEFGANADKIKAIMTMQAYLQTGEDGYMQNVFGDDASLRDIAYSVCAAVDTMSVAQAVESEVISHSEGVDILQIIGMVFGGAVCVWVSAKVGAAVVSLLGTGMLAMVGGLVLTWTLGYTLAEPFMNVGVAVVKGAKSVASFGMKLVILAGRQLVNGFRKLTNSLRTLLNRKRADNTESEHTYTVPNHDFKENNHDNNLIRQPAQA